MGASKAVKRQPPVAAIFRYPVACLLVLGVLTHFVGLTHPREVIFDEVTFGKYVAAYCCTGQRIFDVHPPHGKLLIAAAARVGGFTGSFTFDRIGVPYGDEPLLALRFVPALMGAIIPVLLYAFLVQLNASRPVAGLGGLIVALDNAMIVDTRLIVFDGILVASTLAAVTCFLAAQRHQRIGWELIAAGLLAGLAVGTKTTGLSAIGIIGVCLVFRLGVVKGSGAWRLRQALVVIASATGVYAAGWILHAMLLTQPGPADAFYTTTGNIVDDLLTAHRAMLRYNIELAAMHPDGSRAWTWPLMKVAPYFWQGQGASIHMVGNPVAWWGSTLVLTSVLVYLVILRPLGVRITTVNQTPRPWVALVSYAIAFLPLWPVTRVAFLYHYLTALTFAIAFLLLWLERCGWVPVTPSGRPQRSYLVIVVLAVVGFTLISPVTYGFSAGTYDESLVTWIRSWR